MRRWAAYLLGIAVSCAVGLPDMAQQPGKIFRIGVLSPAASPSTKAFDSLRKGLRDLGYIEGTNITIEYRLAAWDYSRLPPMAGELVRLPVDVIVTDTQKSAVIAHEATRTIPIVGATLGADPVAASQRGRSGDRAHRGPVEPYDAHGAAQRYRGGRPDPGHRAPHHRSRHTGSNTLRVEGGRYLCLKGSAV